MTALAKNQRPSERVEKFFQAYLERHGLTDGDRFPSTRAIAAEIGISEGTVRNVARKWSREGKLHSQRGSGTFVRLSRPNLNHPIRIGTNAGILDEAHFSGWFGGICMHASRTALELGHKASFTSIFSAAEYDTGVSKEETERRCSQLDAVILSSISINATWIADYCRKNRKPYIFLNPWENDSTVNFVAPSHFTASYRLAQALRQCGRTHFAALIYPEIELSASVRERLAGIVNGIGAELGRSVSLRIVACDSYGHEDGYRGIQQLEQEGYRPDAVLCAGDGLAVGAVTALKELGISIPREASVIAGTGMEAAVIKQQLTRLVLPVSEMGRELVLTLVKMVETQTLELPGRILSVGLVTGSSTTERESELLKDLFQENAFA